MNAVAECNEDAVITKSQFDACMHLFADREINALMRKLLDFDIITFRHSVDVSCMVSKILEQSYHISKDEEASIVKGALLHDIGKITVGAEIIKKPGKLTADEFREIQKHPEYGLKILHNETSINDKVVEDIIFFHHEKPDGSGYPLHVKRDEIPWYVELITTADIYDALRSTRPYHECCGKDETLDILWDEGLDENAVAALQKFLYSVDNGIN